MIFDGLQVLDNPYNRGRLTTDFLNDASKHIKKQVGISLDIKIKEFDEGFNIDLNAVKDANNIKKIKSYEETKSKIEETTFKIRHPPMIVSNKSKGYEYQSLKSYVDSYKDIQYLGVDKKHNSSHWYIKIIN